MGLFSFLKNNTLKVIEWLDDSKNTIVYRYPMDGRRIMFGSKLTVRASQIAVFVNKGKVADVFQPGIYTLATSNLPILTQLLSFPYGFKSPFYSEVYFINTKQFANQKWGTSNPIAMRDKEFGNIRIRAFGKFSFKVDNAEIFLNELFGTNSTFVTEDITNYLKSMLVSGISDTIAESKVSALDLACNLSEFNEVVKASLSEKFAELGLKLANLVIENISFPEEIEKALDTRSSMGILSDKMDTYVKYQTANAMRDAANNPNGGFVNAGVGIGAGFAINNMMKDSLSQNNEPNMAKKHCTNCGAEMKRGAKFCPECGEKQMSAEGVCPECGNKVSPKAKFCGYCGAKLK